MNIDEMTPRQLTYALKRHGVRIDHMEPFNSECDYWFVQFSDGDTVHARTIHTFKEFDGKAACEREAREIAKLEKLKSLYRALKNKICM